jgi:hypothetical protein
MVLFCLPKNDKVAPVQGRASCPSKNNVRPIFKNGWSICQRLEHFQRLGHFLRKGMKPFPAQDMRT